MVPSKKLLTFFIILVLYSLNIYCKKHKINAVQDRRPYIHLTSFGFAEKGSMSVNVSNLKKSNFYLLTLDVTTASASQLYPAGGDKYTSICESHDQQMPSIVLFTFNFEDKLVMINRSKNLENLTIHDKSAILSAVNYYINNKLNATSYNASSIPVVNSTSDEDGHISKLHLLKDEDTDAYMLSFEMIISNNTESGLYTLTFHNCDKNRPAINLTVDIIEKNNDRFLTVGDMPLPNMYYVFFGVGMFLSGLWLYILCRSEEEVFKMHYLMFALMLIKSISLLFHGINYHFIDVHGEKEETFAILFYIIYLIRGIIMFVTIILIGAGWTFVKHILSEKEKKIFVIVIPMQILTNVAHIIMFESEEGEVNYNTWYHVFMLVDLACCGAILFPVIWSIRHLQQASATDGKAAINLEKLKIFRHFYMLVVFYIYFTRVIILLLSYTIPFKYTWIDDLLVESSTICFFVITAYKFRPASKNPYLLVWASDDEEGEIEILTESGALETVVNVKFKNKKQMSEMEKPILAQENEENE